MIGPLKSDKQERFARAIAQGENQSDAYRRSYNVGRSKPETIHQSACLVAADPKVAQRIAELKAKIADKSVLNAVEIIDELRKLAHSDIRSIMHPDGKVKLPHELDAATARSVASFEIDEFGRVKYKFWPKTAALDQAMKHLGLYEKDNAQKPLANIGKIELVAPKGSE